MQLMPGLRVPGSRDPSKVHTYEAGLPLMNLTSSGPCCLCFTCSGFTGIRLVESGSHGLPLSTPRSRVLTLVPWFRWLEAELRSSSEYHLPSRLYSAGNRPHPAQRWILGYSGGDGSWKTTKGSLYLKKVSEEQKAKNGSVDRWMDRWTDIWMKRN